MILTRWGGWPLMDKAGEESGGGTAVDDDIEIDDEVREVGKSRSKQSEPDDDEDDESDEESESDSESDDDSEPADEDDDSTLRDYLKSQGVEIDAENDEDAVKQMLQWRQQSDEARKRLESQQAQWQAAQQQMAQQQAWQQQQLWAWQQQQAQQSTQNQRRQLAGVLAHWNQIPEYNEQWLQFVGTDEQGNPVVKPGGDPTLLQKIEARRQWERQGMQQLLQNPVEFAGQAVFANPVFHQYVQQQVQQQVSAVRSEYRASQLLDQVRPLIEELDGTGQLKLTAFGQAYSNALAEVSRYTADVDEAHKFALKAAYPFMPRATAPSGKAASGEKKPSGKDKRWNIMKRQAERSGGRGGSLPKPGLRKASQNKRLDAEERLAAAFEGMSDEDFK